MNQVVEQLRSQTKSNKAFNAVCHIFALRERFRKQVTVQALQFKMRTEGFVYSKQDYENVIKFLGDLKLGVVRTNKKNKVMGIYDLKKPLRTIGRAALGEENELTKEEPKKEPVWQRNIYPSVLTVIIGSKPVNVNLAASLTKEEVKTVIEKFADQAMAINTIVNGKTVEMNLSKGVGSEEIASIVKRLQGRVV